jgi:hypothetical protein
MLGNGRGEGRIARLWPPRTVPQSLSASPIWWFFVVHQQSQAPLKNREMSLLITQLMPCPSVLGAEDEDVFCRLLSSATAAEGVRHRGDSRLKEKSIQAICSHSQLDSQQALCLPKPLMRLQDICLREGQNQVRVGRAFG